MNIAKNIHVYFLVTYIFFRIFQFFKQLSVGLHLSLSTYLLCHNRVGSMYWPCWTNMQQGHLFCLRCWSKLLECLGFMVSICLMCHYVTLSSQQVAWVVHYPLVKSDVTCHCFQMPITKHAKTADMLSNYWKKNTTILPFISIMKPQIARQ